MSSITLGTNVASRGAQRRLAESTNALGRTFERLSSGQRINRASDDAAGLSVVSSLDTKRRVFTQGIRNFNDGISLLNIADGAAEQLSSITVRLKELAEQAANGTYGAKQRQSLDAEAQALSKEYFRIARSTTFNGRGVFFAEFGELRLQGGYGGSGGIQSGLGGTIGTGSLGSPSQNSDASLRFAVAAGDLNGDGIIDLVSGGYDSNGRVLVQLGLGDGTFGNATSYGSAAIVEALSMGDVNNDGILDIVSGDVSRVHVRLGTGTGTFGAATSYTMSSGALWTSLADVNGDGNLDLASSRIGVTIRYGSGSGTFGSETTYTMTGNDGQVAFGDLNGDQIIDMAAAGFGGGTGRVATRLGTGNGSFGAVTTYVTGTGSSDIALGDLNEDGRLDITAADGNGSAYVLLGTSTGTFGSATSYTMLNGLSEISIGDLNGDGVLDLIGAGYATYYDERVTIRLGVGNGTFAGQATYGNNGDPSALFDLVLGDVNGDGVQDVITADYLTTKIRPSNTTQGISPLLPFSLTSRADALQALSQFDQALNRLSTQLGIIGAFHSRINVAENVLQATTENYAAAADRIQDADVAEESAKLVRTQILQQAASAVLAQANQQPALAIKLLST